MLRFVGVCFDDFLKIDMGSALSLEYSYTASSITHILFTGPWLSGHMPRGGIFNHPDLGQLTSR